MPTEPKHAPTKPKKSSATSHAPTKPKHAVASGNPEKGKTNKLQAQVNRQKGRVEGRGGKVEKEEAPSLVDKIFGAMSVGGALTSGFASGALAKNKAMQGNVAKGMNQKQQNAAFVAGLGGAVSNVAAALHGRDIETYSDVLNKAGVKNKYVRAVAGFGGDVALDPLTYLSGGIVKAIPKAKVIAEGARAAEAAKLTPEAIKIGQAAEKAATTSILQNVILKQKASSPLHAIAMGYQGSQGAKGAAKAAIEAHATDVAETAMEALRKANPGKVQLKVGKKVLAESEKVYKGGAKLGEVIGNVPGAGEVRNMFSTAHRFPAGIKEIKRRAESFGVAVHDDISKFYDETFKDLTKADRVTLQHANDTGLSLKNVLGTKGADMEKAQDDLLTIYRDLGDKAQHQMKSIDGQHPNFVYHYYKNFNKADAKKFKKLRKQLGGKLPTLREAEAAGLDPVVDAVEALKLYDAKLNRTEAGQAIERGIVGEFGTILKKGEKPAKELGLSQPKSKLWTDENVWFPEEISKSIDYHKGLQNNPYSASKALRTYDKVLSELKFLQTVANPGHHVRNALGDVVLNYEDGVVNPLRYKQAVGVVMNRNNPKGKIRVGNQFLSYGRIWEDYIRAGGKSGFYPTEISGTGGNKALTKVGDVIKGGKKRVRDASEIREDITRMAHFIDSYKKEGAGAKSIQDLIAAADKAGSKVRKHNIDYGDLTQTEQDWMKRIIPYYTWMRKNVPLQVEMMALHPGRLAAAPKAQRALETAMGLDNDQTGQVIPKWIREMGGINIRGEGEGKNSVYWTPANPMLDPINMVSGGPQAAMSQLLSQTTPGIRMPFEYAQGKNLFTGAPIKDNSKYATDIIPQVRLMRKLSEDLKGKSGKDAKITFLNWLTGAGLQEVGEKQKQSELRRQQDSLQAFIRKSNEKRKSGK